MYRSSGPGTSLLLESDMGPPLPSLFPSTHYWWLLHSLLVVSLFFLDQNFGRYRRPANGTFSKYECRLSIGDTQRCCRHSNLIYCNQIRMNFLHQEVAGVLLHILCSSLAFSHLIFPSVSEGFPVVVVGLLYFLHVVLLSLNVNLRD